MAGSHWVIPPVEPERGGRQHRKPVVHRAAEPPSPVAASADGPPEPARGPLVWLVMPFVAGYLSVRWLVRASVQGFVRVVDLSLDAIGAGLRAFGHLLAELGRRIAAVLRTAAHAVADVLRAAWRVTVTGLRLAGRLLVRAVVALRPVGRLTRRTVERLWTRTIVLGALLVLTVRVALWAAARALAVAGRATRTALRATWRTVVVVSAPMRAAIRWAASAIATASRWTASMLLAAARGAGRLIAGAWTGFLRPALRKAAFSLKVAFAVVVVLPVITARRAIARAIAVLRRPMPAVIRAIVEAVRGSVLAIRRSLGEARSSVTAAIRGARDGVRGALHDAREGIATLFGNRPVHRGGPRHP